MNATAPADATIEASASSDALTAIRNSLKLGGSLLCTWGIALGARLLLPRYLGPDHFGALNFAEAFATTFFVLLGLGLDTYIRKEVPVRPAHASDFFGGMLVIRLAIALGIFGAMAAVMRATHRPDEVRLLVYAFGGAQLLVSLNASLAALLHAHGTVDGLSVTNVVSKVGWGAGIALTLVLDAGLVGIPLSLLVAEAGKSTVLGLLARKNLRLQLTTQLLPAAKVVLAALPFYLSVVSHTVYNKLDVSFLAVVANDREVGWYGAASTLAGITMLITPLLGWVMMPLFAKSRARSAAEYTQVVRRSMELVLAIAVPASLGLALGADLWVEGIFGSAFAPAALALRLLAPLFVLTYVAMVCGICLTIDERAWTLTAISVGGLLINPLLNWLLIEPGMRFFGPAGGGAGCAIAQLGTELLVTGAMLYVVGRRSFDRRSLTMLAKVLGIALFVVGVHLALEPLGRARIVIDAGLYFALFALVRAVPVRETFAFARTAFSRQGRLRD